MLRWFETRLDPYPKGDPVEPPKGLLEFCLHYSDGAKKWLALMAAAAAGVAIGEIIVFGFIGDVVNWLAAADPDTFLETDGWKLALMGAMVVFIVPGIALISTLTMHQTLLGNFPQRIRWMAHRYLIRQSMSYFQDEFAGRIGAKLMQTSLAVREVVMKLLDMLVYVVVYFTGAVILAASADWRLAIPFLVWLAAYVSLMIYFIPRMGKISQAQAASSTVIPTLPRSSCSATPTAKRPMPRRPWMASSTPSTGRCGCSPCSTCWCCGPMPCCCLQWAPPASGCGWAGP
jgi:ATP-binding cassette subfamily B multidrug efflux pump